MNSCNKTRGIGTGISYAYGQDQNLCKFTAIFRGVTSDVIAHRYEVILVNDVDKSTVMPLGVNEIVSLFALKNKLNFRNISAISAIKSKFSHEPCVVYLE